MRYLGKIIGVFFIINFILIPALVLGSAFWGNEVNVVEQFHFISIRTITDGEGNTQTEEYDFNHRYDEVTITITENDTILSTETRAVTREDPLLNDHPRSYAPEGFTPARTEESKKDGYVYLHYYDASGILLGHSDLAYNTDDLLGRQRDYDAAGNLTRTIEHTWGSFRHTELVPKDNDNA